MSWWEDQVRARLPPGPTIIVPTTLYGGPMFAQPDHDPFAPHEEVVELGFPAGWKAPEPQLAHEPLVEAAVEVAALDVTDERAVAVEPTPVLNHRSEDGVETVVYSDGTSEQHQVGLASVTGSGEPVTPAGKPADSPTPGASDEDDQTPSPAVKRNRGRRGAARRSPARASKLAEELEGE